MNNNNIAYNAQGELIVNNEFNDICDDSEIELPSIDSKTTDINYAKYKGKVVVLVDSNNPWYLNTDNTIQLQPKTANPVLYPTNSIINDPIAHAQYTNEHFENTSDNSIESSDKNNMQTIILILLFIAFLLIIYKFYKKNDCVY
jgi:hypothetical protein